MENEELNRYTPDTPKAPERTGFYTPEPLGGPSIEPKETPAPQPAPQPQVAAPQPAAPAYNAPQTPPPAYTPTPEAASRYTPDVPKKKKKKGGTLKLIIVGLCCSLIGGALGAFVYSLLQPESEAETSKKSEKSEIVQSDGQNTVDMLEGLREDAVIDITQIDTSKQLTAAEVYAANVNSTVGITTSITTNWFGYESTSAASGSGFIISDDGYIVTNFHVIENSESITVSLYDGTEYDAILVGYDQSNDLAVLKVEAEGLPPVILGDSDNMNVGDPVVAIGNPLGELTFSLTSGTVSAMDRSVTMSNGITMKLIQTDCAINSGNSGGALFNLYGEVVGITNAKYSSPAFGASIDNIGFAIPLNDVRDIIDSIIEKGYISKPYIGVTVADVSEESQSLGLPAGAAVRSIIEDSPAEECGLQEGDIITHVDGTAIATSNELVELIGGCEIGQEVKLSVYRKNETIELTLTVGEQTQAANAASED